MTSTRQPGWKEFHRRILRRPTSAAVVSVIAHIFLGVLVWNAVQMPGVFDQLLQQDRTNQPRAEKIEFVTITPLDTAAAPVTPTRRPPPPNRAPAPTAPPAGVPLTPPTE